MAERISTGSQTEWVNELNDRHSYIPTTTLSHHIMRHLRRKIDSTVGKLRTLKGRLHRSHARQKVRPADSDASDEATIVTPTPSSLPPVVPSIDGRPPSPNILRFSIKASTDAFLSNPSVLEALTARATHSPGPHESDTHPFETSGLKLSGLTALFTELPRWKPGQALDQCHYTIPSPDQWRRLYLRLLDLDDFKTLRPKTRTALIDATRVVVEAMYGEDNPKRLVARDTLLSEWNYTVRKTSGFRSTAYTGKGKQRALETPDFDVEHTPEGVLGNFADVGSEPFVCLHMSNEALRDTTIIARRYQKTQSSEEKAGLSVLLKRMGRGTMTCTEVKHCLEKRSALTHLHGRP